MSTLLRRNSVEDAEVAVRSAGLRAQSRNIRLTDIPWDSYANSNIISREDAENIKMIDKLDVDRQKRLFEKQASVYARLFMSLLTKVNKESVIQYVLTMLDDILAEGKACVRAFLQMRDQNSSLPYQPMFDLMKRNDVYTKHTAAKVISEMMEFDNDGMAEEDQQFYLSWISEHLRQRDEQQVQEVVMCLQHLLRKDSYRVLFAKGTRGVETLLDVLTNRKPNFQMQYQLLFCLWLLSFNKEVVKYLEGTPIVSRLADILRSSSKEKVSRIALSICRNLLEKSQSEEPRLRRKRGDTEADQIAVKMLNAKILHTVRTMETRQWADEDVPDDLEAIRTKLEDALEAMTSFDLYAAEVRSGRLEWSPVHRSEKFWYENVELFNEKSHELLKLLIEVVSTSDDPTVLAVGCHDLGEYVRHYPFGKKALDELGGKDTIMALMNHSDTAVRYEALLAIQKMMLNNWEVTGKMAEGVVKGIVGVKSS
eukprot:Clim_evm62s156 gene=Clim_evmTU62s156